MNIDSCVTWFDIVTLWLIVMSHRWTLIRVWLDLILSFPFQKTKHVWLQMGGYIKQLDDLSNVTHESRVIYIWFSTDKSCLVSWPLRIWDIEYCDNFFHFTYFLHFVAIIIQSSGIYKMTKHTKMGLYTGKATGPYNGKANLCLLQENQLENLKTKMRRKLNKAQKQATNPTRMSRTRPSVMCTLTPDTRIRACVMMMKMIVGPIIRRLGCSGMRPRCDLWIALIVGCQRNHILISPSFE